MSPWNTPPFDMPAAGQTQLLNYVNAGGGRWWQANGLFGRYRDKARLTS
jgi:hypothetical protein